MNNKKNVKCNVSGVSLLTSEFNFHSKKKKKKKKRNISGVSVSLLAEHYINVNQPYPTEHKIDELIQ